MQLSDAMFTASMDLDIEASEREKKIIARYLHDTIGHNIAYLCLKLDQLLLEGTNNNRLDERELRRMLDVARQAYDQVSFVLADLRAETANSVLDSFLVLAEQFRERTEMEIQVLSDGLPLAVPSYIQRHILYTMREALHNVEKYAKADQVVICLTWDADLITISVKDNGQGFDLEKVMREEGHYGLKIMRECIKELEGGFSIDTEPGVGTQVSFSIPFKTFQVGKGLHIMNSNIEDINAKSLGSD